MILKSELEQRAEDFNHYWLQFLPDQSPKELYQAARHLPMGGGKRLRPVLAMLACQATGGNVQEVMPFAAALELMHNFTLVHDDIMDNSHLRRGVPTVHEQYSQPTAILAGDLLFAKTFEAMHQLSTTLDVIKYLEAEMIKCIIDICEGQEYDMSFEHRTQVQEPEYLQMIEKKTAALFRLSTLGGAVIAQATDQQIKAMRTYGYALGMAFQIWDDYLDMSSDEQTLGKDIGNDIRNGKKTLIAVHAFSHAKHEQKQQLERFFGNRNATDDEIHKVLESFKTSGSIDYAKKIAHQYHQQAIDALDAFPSSHAKSILEEMVTYAIQREK